MHIIVPIGQAKSIRITHYNVIYVFVGVTKVNFNLAPHLSRNIKFPYVIRICPVVFVPAIKDPNFIFKNCHATIRARIWTYLFNCAPFRCSKVVFIESAINVGFLIIAAKHIDKSFVGYYHRSFST